MDGVAAVRRSVLLSSRPEAAIRDIARLARRHLGASEAGVWIMSSRTWVTDSGAAASARLAAARTTGELRDGVLRFTVSGHGRELATLVGLWTPSTSLDLAASTCFEELSEYAGLALLTANSSAPASVHVESAASPGVPPYPVALSPVPPYPVALSPVPPSPASPPGSVGSVPSVESRDPAERDPADDERLLADLRTAIMTAKIEPHYQPILRLADGKVMAFEALARWHHEVNGWMSPAEFIPLAERHGLIATLGMRILKDAAAQSAVWSRRPGDDTRIVVNLSPVQLQSASLVTEIGNLMRRHRLAAGRVILELTSTGSFDTARTAGLLERFEGAGVRIAVSEPEAVHHLRASAAEVAAGFVKIPRRLVGSAISSSATRREIERLVADGRSAGLSATAEGIETREELEVLSALGVGFGGGFLWSAAVPGSEATDLLDRQPWLTSVRV